MQTLTTGIFSTWLNGGNAGGAAQIAGVILVLMLVLAGDGTGQPAQRAVSPPVARSAAGRRRSRCPAGGRWAATGLVPGALRDGVCAAGGGDAGPCAGAIPRSGCRRGWCGGAAIRWWWAGIAAVLTVAGGAVSGLWRAAWRGASWPRLVLPVTSLGYAAPGAVLAVGLLIPLAALDHRVADADAGG